jgi:two-component system NtrC family sensor kinase
LPGARAEARKRLSPSVEDQLTHLHTLQRRIALLLIMASLIPLGFISAGAAVVFGRIISDNYTERLAIIVRDHAAGVDLFLQERLMALDLVARSYSREEVVRPEALKEIFRNLNESYTASFLDLGVIDESGNHLAYVGPYDLLGRNYAGAPWFEHVAKEGTYISDVFLGVRHVPHFIMAVRKDEAGGFWILRATINSRVFSDMVRRGRLGVTGDCFILDREGRFQTPPLSGGKLLEVSGIDVGSLARGDMVDTQRARSPDGRRFIRTMKWIKNGEWLLVAQQEERELRGPFRLAMFQGMGFFALGMVVIVLVALFTTSYLFRLIENAVEQKEQLTTQLLQASKLASLGEMATGLAHEINNPLATIATEQTNIADLVGLMGTKSPELDEIVDSVAMTKKQVMRCKAITQKMLQFGRQRLGEGAVIDLGPQLQEIVKLMKPQARVNNVEICLEMEPGLPPIYIDPTELQQLVVNILNNAIGAIASHGAVLVSAWREEKRLHITIEDTGPGIPAEVRERIFEPFFTTKAVGKGTGLGLSVSYGIVTKWRGKIKLVSKPGAGATFDVEFPAAEERAPAA